MQLDSLRHERDKINDRASQLHADFERAAHQAREAHMSLQGVDTERQSLTMRLVELEREMRDTSTEADGMFSVFFVCAICG